MNRKVKLEKGIELKTKTYTYMLPLLCKELGLATMKQNLINVFLKHENYPEMNNHLFCLYEWKANKHHTNFEKMLIEHPLCELHEDVSSKHYICGFSINDNMKYDYDCFVKGKYSHIKPESKKQIQDFFSLNSSHVVMMVLNKDKKLKVQMEEALNTKLEWDAELSSVIDINRETYKPSCIIESKSPLPSLSRL